MTRFLSVRDNSLHTRGFPWASRIVVGLDNKVVCGECRGVLRRPEGDLQVMLERDKGNKWPDALGCGHYPLFIVSERTLEAWQKDGVGEFPIGGAITFLDPLPKKLEQMKAPSYVWLDGDQMLGARLDFEASGFVGVQFCGTCGRRWDDIKATFHRQHSMPWSHVFVDGTWNGVNLFTTDISPTAFFCTDKVVESAIRHRLTNFRFVPVEEGDACGGPGVQYLKGENVSSSAGPA